MATLVTTTEAPGMSAPDGSEILPLMVPRVSCDQPSPQASTISMAVGDMMRRSISTPKSLFLSQSGGSCRDRNTAPLSLANDNATLCSTNRFTFGQRNTGNCKPAFSHALLYLRPRSTNIGYHNPIQARCRADWGSIANGFTWQNAKQPPREPKLICFLPDTEETTTLRQLLTVDKLPIGIPRCETQGGTAARINASD